jgi:hypothetical protein
MALCPNQQNIQGFYPSTLTINPEVLGLDAGKSNTELVMKNEYDYVTPYSC